MEFIVNGSGFGSIADRLLAAQCDPGVLRPYDVNGRTYVDLNVNGQAMAVPITAPQAYQMHGGLNVNAQDQLAFNLNAPTTLTKDAWKHLDEAIIKVALPRLQAFGDLRRAGLTYTVPNGMGKTVLETQKMSNVSGANISMDALRKGDRKRPLFTLENFPLPIIHDDFSYSLREIQTSRESGAPLDTTGAEMAARNVVEEIEKLTIGVSDFDGFSFGGGTIYGYKDFPDRNTYTITAPDSAGWTGAQFISEVLGMIGASRADNMNGPWTLYVSQDWDEYLDADYSGAKGDNTLRERTEKIRGINAVTTLDYLDGWNVVLVQQTQDVARAVVGMEITTLQWDSEGGLQKNFKVMAILVPQLRSDYDGQCGIVHGNVA